MLFWPSQGSGPVPTKGEWRRLRSTFGDAHTHTHACRGHGNEINRGRNEWTQKDEWSVMRTKNKNQKQSTNGRQAEILKRKIQLTKNVISFYLQSGALHKFSCAQYCFRS